MIKHFTYTKASGEQSDRKAVIMKSPQTNFLMLDLTQMDEVQINTILDHLDKIEALYYSVLQGLR